MLSSERFTHASINSFKWICEQVSNVCIQCLLVSDDNSMYSKRIQNKKIILPIDWYVWLKVVGKVKAYQAEHLAGLRGWTATWGLRQRPISIWIQQWGILDNRFNRSDPVIH